VAGWQRNEQALLALQHYQQHGHHQQQQQQEPPQDWVGCLLQMLDGQPPGSNARL
jgi:hypothetical protein